MQHDRGLFKGLLKKLIYILKGQMRPTKWIFLRFLFNENNKKKILFQWENLEKGRFENIS